MDFVPPIAPDRISLVPVETAPGCAAWQATEPDAPGLFALISDREGLSIPAAPEIDDLTIAIFDKGVKVSLESITIDGRPGLNRWYLQHVGHEPDKEPSGPRPILELIDLVAGHLLLRYFEEGRLPDAG